MNRPPSEHDDCAAPRIELDLLGAPKPGKASVIPPDMDELRRERFQEILEKTGKRYAKAFEELAK